MTDTADNSALTPPQARRELTTSIHYGKTRTDPYAWLRTRDLKAVLDDPNHLEPDIRALLEAENRYTDAILERLNPEKLFTELTGRLPPVDASVPELDGEYAYYLRYETGSEYPVYARKRVTAREELPSSVADSTEEVLLRVGDLAAETSYLDVDSVQHSPDHARLGYAIDTVGSERYELRFVDLGSGRVLALIPNTSGNFVWAADSQTVIYTQLDDEERPRTALRATLPLPKIEAELDPSQIEITGTELYHEVQANFFVHVDITEDGRFLSIEPHTYVTSEIWVIPADQPNRAPELLWQRRDGTFVEYSHAGESFYLLLREPKERDGKVVRSFDQARQLKEEQLEVVIPYRHEVLLDSFGLKRDWLIWRETSQAISKVIARNLETGREKVIPAEETVSELHFDLGYEFEAKSVRLFESSPRRPTVVRDYDLIEETSVVRKVEAVATGHNPEEYRVERATVRARDSEQIPVTLLSRWDAPRPAPLFLYVYGSYGYSTPCSFDPHIFSLVDRGVTLALAHVRGGLERGYAWYEAARGLNKPVTLRDYLDVARGLIQIGETSAGQIVGYGGSAGGLVTAVAANWAPELFAALIAEVPFVDCVTTMLDETLPLTPPEWPEWGNPARSQAEFETLLSYSPYDNVAPQTYPAILATTGLTDSRVTYWEPVKWVQKLRDAQLGDDPILLRVQLEQGHSGQSGRYQSLRDLAEVYAFALSRLDLM